MCPKLLKGPKGGSQNETTEEEKNWGMFPNLQHFGVGGCVGVPGWD
jgi:hypothetical protein